MFEAIFDSPSGCVYLPELRVLAAAVDGDALAQGTLMEFGPTPWDQIQEAQARFAALELVVIVCGEAAEIPESLARQFESALMLSKSGTRTLTKDGCLFSVDSTSTKASVSPAPEGGSFYESDHVHLPLI